MPWQFRFSGELCLMAIELDDSEFLCSSQSIRSMREGVIYRIARASPSLDLIPVFPS